MVSSKDKIILTPGCLLQHKDSHSKGFMQEADIDEYDIVAPLGEHVGTVIVTNHMAVRGFRRTVSVEQRDKAGKIIVKQSWNK